MTCPNAGEYYLFVADVYIQILYALYLYRNFYASICIYLTIIFLNFQYLLSLRPPPREVARIGGTGLLAYLRPRIQSVCKNLYPTNPDAVDEILTGNILRDSLDPGAINVMISGSKLPPPRTANELLGADFGSVKSQSKEDSSIIAAAEGMWEGKTLVAQGFLDPLNDAKARARLFGELRKGITVKPINAGHCPHDELDEDVANAIGHWLLETTKKENEVGKDSGGIESSSDIIS